MSLTETMFNPSAKIIAPHQASLYSFGSGLVPTGYITIPIFGSAPLTSQLGMISPMFPTVSPSPVQPVNSKTTIVNDTRTQRSNSLKTPKRTHAYSNLVPPPSQEMVAPNGNSVTSSKGPRSFFNDKLFKQNAQWSVKELYVLQACLKNNLFKPKEISIIMNNKGLNKTGSQIQMKISHLKKDAGRNNGKPLCAKDIPFLINVLNELLSCGGDKRRKRSKKFMQQFNESKMMNDISLDLMKLDKAEAEDVRSTPNTPTSPGIPSSPDVSSSPSSPMIPSSPTTPVMSPPGSPTNSGPSSPIVTEIETREAVVIISSASPTLDAFLNYSEEDWQHLEQSVLVESNFQSAPPVAPNAPQPKFQLTQEIENWWN